MKRREKISYVLERWRKYGHGRRRKWCFFDRVSSRRVARRYAGWERRFNGLRVRVVREARVTVRKVLGL